MALAYAIGGICFLYQAFKASRPIQESLWALSLLTLTGLFGSKLFHVLFEAKGHILPNGNPAKGVFDLLAADPFHWLYIDEPGFVLYGGLLAGGLVLLKYCEYGNLLIWPLSLGMAIGRVDCYLNGCCYGLLGWPIQIAEALFVLLLGWRAHTLKTWILGYALWRFGIEFFRADNERGLWALGLSTSQWISLLIITSIKTNNLNTNSSKKQADTG